MLDKILIAAVQSRKPGGSAVSFVYVPKRLQKAFTVQSMFPTFSRGCNRVDAGCDCLHNYEVKEVNEAKGSALPFQTVDMEGDEKATDLEIN